MKHELKKPSHVFPMPTTLVGALVNGRPNFITIAWNGVVDYGVISISLGKTRHTTKGIKETGTYSLNIPSVDLVKETDYCGCVSGKDVDKSTIFKIFYGKLKTAPMIEECPATMECKVLQTLEYTTHDVFIGEIVATYADEDIMTDGVIDPAKLDPFFFTTTDMAYYKMGEKVSKAYEPGKKYEKK
jgi:flavin reductase (DIM6/NTAB) family NADH-FMN oxidoreductase RutF